ncbi:MAG: hypothetical protein MK179_12205 [Pirellulaceae bacterium]|nr:hypothetical protein [Pirellulaceae bacterium]
MRRFHDFGWTSVLLVGVSLLCMVGTSGCVTHTNVEVIDLNQVLDILMATMDESDAASAANPANSSQPEDIAQVAAAEEDAAKQQELLTRFATELNSRKLIQSPIGVSLNANGAIEGFTDRNQNMTKDTGDKKLFTVQIDSDRKRLIASDTNDYHREHPYRPRMGGFFTAYMLGSMLGRQNSFYATQPKPRFDNMKMSPKNYHASAVNAVRSKVRSKSSRPARSRSRSARSRSGSRGFSFGK